MPAATLGVLSSSSISVSSSGSESLPEMFSPAKSTSSSFSKTLPR